MTRDAKNNSFYTYSLALLIFIAAYVFSQWILQYYTGGDQVHYTALYESLRWAPISQISDLQFKYTGSTEPLYGLIMWVSASLFEKNIIISFMNSILMVSIFILLRKNRAGFIFTILMFTNYYVLVILTSAERLKFGYIFAILILILPSIWRAAAAIAALTNHYSILIIFISIIFPQKYLETLKSFRKGGWDSFKSSLLFIVIFLSFIVFSILYRDQITNKVNHYQSYDPTDLLQGAILFIIAMIVSNDRLNTAMTLSFPLAATFILGGDRVNMLTISVFIYLVLREGKTRHPAVMMVMAYLSYKSIDYMQNVFAYGTGFLT